MNCTFYLPTYDDKTVIAHRHNDDGMWSIREFGTLGVASYGPQKHKFNLTGIKPYVIMDEIETVLPRVQCIARQRIIGNLRDVGLGAETDKRYWHRDFIEAGIGGHELFVVTHRVYGYLYRDEEQKVSCKVARVSLGDWVNEKGMQYYVGYWGFQNYDNKIMELDKSKMDRMVTWAEARQLAFDAFSERVDRDIEAFKRFAGGME